MRNEMKARLSPQRMRAAKAAARLERSRAARAMTAAALESVRNLFSELNANETRSRQRRACDQEPI